MEGRTIAKVGLGNMGRAVVRIAQALGMKAIGTDVQASLQTVDQYYEIDRMKEMFFHADVIVLFLPHRPKQKKMIGVKEFAAMQKNAHFINIARGAVVDEQALIVKLQSGHLAIAALDVFAEEPLPAESPFWKMPNALFSPHSASTSDRENQRLTEHFCDITLNAIWKLNLYTIL